MNPTRLLRPVLRGLAAGLGLAAGAYAAYVSVSWLRYGRAARPARRRGADLLLDRFMPEYEVAGEHRFTVRAPAEITLAAATNMRLDDSVLARAIFRTRELVLGAEPVSTKLPKGLLEQTKALGWGVLAEVPGREIVMGAVTQPWKANVVFRAVPPADFAAFDEPDCVKIAWTLRADPLGPDRSVFRTETRVATTDAAARAKFRLYWSFFSPGMFLIRLMTRGSLKAEAERRARAARTERRQAG